MGSPSSIKNKINNLAIIFFPIIILCFNVVYSDDAANCDQDIFVHKSQCEEGFNPKQGDDVRFQLSTNSNGNPQALTVTRAPSKIDAKDWFRVRAAERSRVFTNNDASGASLRPDSSRTTRS